MLATFRIPLVDTRYFADDVRVATSVELPRGWGNGDFVRGFGAITSRPSSAPEPWAFESAFADISRVLTFDNKGLQGFEKSFQHYEIKKARKRCWMPLVDSSALIDIDVALTLGSRAKNVDQSKRNENFTLRELSRMISGLVAVPVRVRQSRPEGSRTSRLLNVGPLLANRFLISTSKINAGPSDGVRAGKMTVVLEIPGAQPLDRDSFPAEQLIVGNLLLTSFDTHVEGGGSIRCHVISAPGRSKKDRKLIRELRIHILRLQSVYELMRRLSSSRVVSPSAEVSREQGAPGFDALQRTLLTCARLVRTQMRPGNADAAEVLDTAFFGQNFYDRNLEVALERMTAAMRPKVRRALEALLESERIRQNQDQDSRKHDVSGIAINLSVEKVCNVSKFELNGNNYGNFGEEIHVNQMENVFTVSPFQVGNDQIPREVLLEELRKLAAHVKALDKADAVETVASLEFAVDDIGVGRDAEAASRLRSVGKWGLAVANSLALGVASTAIAAALGLA